MDEIKQYVLFVRIQTTGNFEYSLIFFIISNEALDGENTSN